jgi:hypothetical protein
MQLLPEPSEEKKNVKLELMEQVERLKNFLITPRVELYDGAKLSAIKVLHEIGNQAMMADELNSEKKFHFRRDLTRRRHAIDCVKLPIVVYALPRLSNVEVRRGLVFSAVLAGDWLFGFGFGSRA